MKILITGAQGQVGRALSSVLTSHELILFSKADLDISSRRQVVERLATHRPDLVINTAAYTAVDAAESDTPSAYKINEDGVRILGEGTAALKIPMLHFSTDYVFDGAARVPYTEDDRPNPLSIYGKSKLAGERALIETNPRYFIVRTAWVYHTTGKNFPLTILSFSKKNEVRVVNDQIGSPTYAPHLAAAVGKLIEKKSDYGLYHIAGSGQASWFDVASHLYRKMGITTPVVPVSTVEFPRPALRPAFGVLASNRPGAVFMPPWEQGLDDFVKGVEKL